MGLDRRKSEGNRPERVRTTGRTELQERVAVLWFAILIPLASPM
jgi:hypothetical protein